MKKKSLVLVTSILILALCSAVFALAQTKALSRPASAGRQEVAATPATGTPASTPTVRIPKGCNNPDNFVDCFLDCREDCREVKPGSMCPVRCRKACRLVECFEEPGGV